MAPRFMGKFLRASRHRELTWRYLFNLFPLISYKFTRHSQTDEVRRVLASLNTNGVAISSADALLGPGSYFEEMSYEVERMESQFADEIDTARACAAKANIGNKTFIYSLLGENPVLDPQSVFARFALQSPILQIANAYFGMYTRLRYYNVWRTFTTRTEARESQLWHYDREDYYILKLFVYLSDVDDAAGPFTYAPGTHRKAGIEGEPEYFLEGGVRRTTDEQMARFISPEKWMKCTGSKGTIVFADTRGFHKGGLARERDRLMYTCMFTSQASQSQEFLRRVVSFPAPKDRELAFALSTPGLEARKAQRART